MNALAQQMLGIAKGYLGPAAQAYLSTELRALGVNANTVEQQHVPELVMRVQVNAARAMGEQKAAALAAALAACGNSAVERTQVHGHRLASDAAAKLLGNGKLKPAETAYSELVAKHGDVDSYRGLGRAQAALGNEAAALTTLRDGAARYASSGDRASAVSLLAEAVAVVPHDLAAHRRLAAALANQGDLPGAIDEYARFVDVALQQHDPRRAWLELAYGRETLGDLPGLLAIVDRVAAAGPQAVNADGSGAAPLARNSPAPVSSPPPPAVSRAQLSLATPPPPRPASTPAASILKSAPASRPAPQPVAVSNGKPHPLSERLQAPASNGRTGPDASHTAVVLKGAKTLTHAEQSDLSVPSDLLERAGLKRSGHKFAPPAPPPPRPARPPVDLERELSALVPNGNGLDAASVAASRAALLTGARDARATAAALDAARRLLGLGKLQSASDVLLDYIAHGFNDREAQRLLIEVDCAIGRRDYAKEKCQLLSYAFRLDGRAEVAEDVERLARIL